MTIYQVTIQSSVNTVLVHVNNNVLLKDKKDYRPAERVNTDIESKVKCKCATTSCITVYFEANLTVTGTSHVPQEAKKLFVVKCLCNDADNADTFLLALIMALLLLIDVCRQGQAMEKICIYIFSQNAVQTPKYSKVCSWQKLQD